MTQYHVAIDHPESPDPDSPVGIDTTYLGVVDQAHVDEVRAIADLKASPRFVKEHPHIEGAFMVLRDDGDLDVYVPVGAPEYRVYEPDGMPKTRNEGGDLAGDDAQFVQKKSSASSSGAVGGVVSGNKVWADPEATPGTPEGYVPLPRGASGPVAYISGAVRFGDQVIGGAMDTPGNPPRTVWHTTESPAGGSYFFSVAAYLIRVASQPQVIYDPVTDQIGQFGPLTQSGRALKNDGSRRTNREGKVCIQVEVLGRAASPWTKGFDPAAKPNFRKLVAAMRAHGIPDVWPAGKPPATATAAAKGARSSATWQSKGGHFGHAHVPGNVHWDPGAIDTTIVPGLPPVVAPPKPTTPVKPVTAPARPAYEPFPGAGFFHGGRHSKVITALGRRLVALGFGRHYSNGPGPNWTNADRLNVRDFQLSRADLRGDADGIPGPKTWAALKVPKV